MLRVSSFYQECTQYLSFFGLYVLDLFLFLHDMDDRNPQMLPMIQQQRKGPVRKGRRKINIEYIPDKTRRHVTFSKRKAGIMKKAYELATLTGTQVLLLVASETGHVYTFATPKLQPLITGPEGKNLIQSCLNVPDEPTNEISQKGQLNGNDNGSDQESPTTDLKVHPYLHKKDSSEDDENSEYKRHPKMDQKLPVPDIPSYVQMGSPPSLPYPSLPHMFPPRQGPGMAYPPPHMAHMPPHHLYQEPPISSLQPRFQGMGPSVMPGIPGSGMGIPHGMYGEPPLSNQDSSDY